MNPALWAAKTGLDAQQTRLAVTSNNLANVSTSGFKKGRAVFEDLLYQNVRQVGGSTSQDTRGALGRAPRHRRARGRHGKALHAGRSHADRQCARRGHRRPRLLPDPDARRHHRLHARRQLPVVGAGPDGDLQRLRAAAGHQHSRWLAERHHRPRRRGQRARGRPGRAGAGRPAPAHGLRESRRPAAAGRKPAGRNRRPAVRRRPARPARTASASPRRARSKPRTSTWSKSWST